MSTLLLTGIFAILGFHMLEVARPLLLPIVLAVLANFALTPIVRRLSSWGASESVAAALVVLVLVVVLGAGVVGLSGPAADWLERAPATLRKVETRLRPIRAPVEKIARATREVQEATTIERGDPTGEVRVSERSLFSDLVLQTQGALTTLVVMLALLFFLLSSSDGVARVLSTTTRWAGDEASARSLVHAIEGDVSRHLLTVTLINAGLGLAVGSTLWLFGMPNPALWGAMAGVLNFVPFVGAFLGTLIVTAVALISFDETGRALAAIGAYALLTGLEGMVVTPHVLGRRLTLSPLAVLISLMLWSFLWGVAGALIAVPVLAVVKIVADRVPQLHVLSALLGRTPPSVILELEVET